MKGLGRFQGAWAISGQRGLFSFAEQPVYFHSHHHDIFLDQSVGDALGGEGWAVRRQAAFEAMYPMLVSVFADLGATGPAEKLALASELFSAMGCGALRFSLNAEGGTARGEALFFGQSFQQKYGAQLRNKRVLDAYTSGFISAAATLSYPSDWGVFEAEEISCTGRSDEACDFVISRRPERARFGAELTRSFMGLSNPSEMEGRPSIPDAGIPSTEPEPLPQTPADRLIQGLAADAGGVLSAFGARLVLMPIMYTNQIAFDTMHLVEKRVPELSPVFASLVREAAQMDAFYLLGGVCASPEYQAQNGGAASGDPGARLVQLLEIARALGWGAATTAEFVPDHRLVLRNPSAPEAIYYALRHGKTMRPRLVFQQGLALGIMHLLSAVDLSVPSALKPATYNDLFRNGPRFHVEETRSPLRGDDVSEVVVEAIGD